MPDQNITLLTAALGLDALTLQLAEEQQERIDIIRHKLKFMENKPAVLCIEQLDPLTIAGNWMPELLNIAGGTPILIPGDEADIIILMLRGSSIEDTMHNIDALLQLPGFADMKAVKDNRVYIADGAQYFNQLGPVIVDTLEILAEIIHPKQFSFGYEGQAWIKFAL